jgi:RNA polymerase sigma-70 factor (ECF subfamily)
MATRRTQLSDGALMSRYRGGDQHAATEIYLRYAQKLRSLARARCGADLAPRMDAEDIVQSVFRSFFQGARRGYYDVPAGEELWKLILVIALNKIRAEGAFHRAARRDVGLTTNGSNLDALHHSRRDEDMSVIRLVIEETLARLTPHHRTIVDLRVQGYAVAEIALQTGRSKPSVERNLQEFRCELERLLPERT